MIWKKKKPLEDYKEFFINVIVAKVKNVYLKVFGIKDPDKTDSFIVTWIAYNYPNKEFHCFGEISCARDQKASTYKLAKKRAEAFVKVWFEGLE